jgi:hypothetical protein
MLAHGITAAEVGRRCLHAVQYCGQPCWLVADLAELLGSGREARP